MLGSSGSVARLPGLGKLRFRDDLCDLLRNDPRAGVIDFALGLMGYGSAVSFLQMRLEAFPFWEGSGGSEQGLETIGCHPAPGYRSLPGRASHPQMWNPLLLKNHRQAGVPTAPELLAV